MEFESVDITNILGLIDVEVASILTDVCESEYKIKWQAAIWCLLTERETEWVLERLLYLRDHLREISRIAKDIRNSI